MRRRWNRWWPLVGLLLAACGGEPLPPVAEAGPAQAVGVGQAVILDGSCSFDPDRGRIRLPSERPCEPDPALARYAWTISAAPEGREGAVGQAVGSPSATPQAGWTPQAGDVGRWRFWLEVTDRDGRRATDEVEVEVTP